MPSKTARLQTIALDAMKVWIQQQILETTEPEKEKSCDGSVQCVVNQTLDWRRDYTTALSMALNFKGVQDYDFAISILQKRIDDENSKTTEYLKDLINAPNQVEFNSAAQDLMLCDVLMGQRVFLEKVNRVFSYLNGTLTKQDELKHITPDGKNWMTGSLFSILKDQGTFDEWQNLIGELPKTRRNLYKSHWDTLNPS